MIIIVIFALQNTGSVEIDFFIGAIQAPMVIVILVSVLIGVIVGLIGSVSTIKNNHKSNKDLQKEIKQLKDVHNSELIEKDRQLSSLRTKIRELEQSKKNIVMYTEPIMEIAEDTQERATIDELPTDDPYVEVEETDSEAFTDPGDEEAEDYANV